MTACDIVQTTFDDLETIYTDGAGKYRVDHALTEVDFIGKACGAKQNGFSDWLNATRRNWSRGMQGSRKDRGGRLEIEPFIKSRRDDPINNEYWFATYRSTATNPTLSPEVPAGTYYVHDVHSGTGIPSDPGFFPAGMRVFLSSVDKVSGTKTFTQYIVAHSVVNTGNVRLHLKSAQAGSTADSDSLGHPGIGNVLANSVLTRGLNNVSDYDSYCPTLPALATGRHAYYFVETNRLAFCDSQLTQEYIDMVVKGNPYYREFFHVDDVKYNRQVMEDWDRRRAWAFLFGKATDANQTATDWDKLPEIELDAEGLAMPWDGACVGRRADAVGVLDQLYECNRVWDLQRQALPLGELFARLYEMRRIRQDNGIDANVIELMMDSTYAIQFQTAMLAYFNMRGQGLLRINMEASKPGVAGPFGMRYQSYFLDFPAGLEIRVLTAPFLDDWIDAHRVAYSNGGTDYNLASSASAIWILDWSNVYEAIIGSRTAENSTGDVGELTRINSAFGCRMKVPKQSWRLRSWDRTVVVDCAASSLAILNFDRCVPPDHESAAACTTVFMSGFAPSFPA